MEVGFVGNGIGYVQKKVFDGAHYFSGDTIVGKLCGKPVAVLGACVDTVSSPVKYALSTIEAVVVSALNLVGSTFSGKCRRDLSASSYQILANFVDTVLHTSSALPKIACQVALGLWNHQEVDTVASRRGDRDNYVYRTRRAPATPVALTFASRGGNGDNDVYTTRTVPITPEGADA